jgi:hypothetical protein
MKRIASKACIIIFLVSLSTTFPVESQQLTTTELEAHIKEYFQTSPWEEMYLHIDRDKYIAGEDIWFSIYAIDRLTGKLSSRSTVAYVELLNPWNIPVIQKRYKLSGGVSEGNILLPDSISSGTYTIRAYTNWMKNFFPDNCYMLDIDICNPFKSSDFRRKVDFIHNKSDSLSLRFFPESGKLYNGIINKVAVSCMDYHGEGVAFTGIIKDNKGDSVTCFSTDAGYGSFFITPENAQDYSVSASGSLFRLPKAINDGISGAVDNSLYDRIQVRISAVGPSVLSSSNTYLFLIQANGKTVYMNSLKIKDIITEITVPGEILTGGVSYIVMIDEDNKIVFQRKIYNQLKNKYTVNIKADSIYGRRERVSMRLGISNSDGNQSGISNMSISITPAEFSSLYPEIEDYMIFGSEFGKTPRIKAHNRNPDLNPELLDNFLLCSESRWISWQNILSGRTVPEKYNFETNGHNLSLIIKYREDNVSDSSNFLYMSIQGKVAEFRYAGRDSTGRFTFNLPVDNKFRNLIVQPEHANKNMILEIEPSFSWIMPSTYSFSDTFSDSQLDVFSELSFNYQASRIYGIMLRKDIETDHERNMKKRRFYGIPEMEINLDDYIMLPTMQEVFFELIPGIILRTRKSGYEMRITNPLTGTFYNEPPLVMIDGVIVNDLKVLADLSPETVAKVEVVKTPYLIGDLILHGIVNVITRSGNFSNIIMPEYAVILPYQVVDKPSIINLPDYSDEKNRLNRTPDLRNTLYWNPSVKTDRNEEAEIEFWTSDLPGIYHIHIVGISGTGEKVSLHKSFTVR